MIVKPTRDGRWASAWRSQPTPVQRNNKIPTTHGPKPRETSGAWERPLETITIPAIKAASKIPQSVHAKTVRIFKFISSFD